MSQYRVGLVHLENYASEVWGQIYDICDILTMANFRMLKWRKLELLLFVRFWSRL